MEILSKNEDILKHVSHAISNKDLELEVIFGWNERNNPINKVLFMKILDKLRIDYTFISESINLDIRTKTYKYPSNVRCSLLDLESIKNTVLLIHLKEYLFVIWNL